MLRDLTKRAPATLLGFSLFLVGCGDSGSSAISQLSGSVSPAALKAEADVPAERGAEASVASVNLGRVEAPTGDVTMERCMAQRRYLVFHTNEALDAVNDTNGVSDVYLRDLLTGTVTLVSKNSAGTAGNGASSNATISLDGKRIAFQSLASDLVAGDGNGKSDVFLSTRVGQVTTRISLTVSNAEAADDSSFPALSSNGSFVTFVSKADLTGVGTSGIQNLYMRKVDGSTTKLFSRGSGTGANAPVYSPVMSSDTRYIAYVSAASNLVAGDTNNANDIFLFDRATGLTERVSLDSAGGQADGSSSMPSISDDGNVIAFESKATNLVAGDTNGLRDLFVRNRSTGTTTRVSVDATGAQPNGISYHATLTRDGSRVAFASQASNLVAGDTNNVADVFQRLVADPTSIARASRNIVGDVQGDGASDLPSYDSDDNDLAFRSSSTNLDWANVVSNNEIFLANRASGTASVVGRSLATATEKVTDGIGGAAANTASSFSGSHSMSADGRYVVFRSSSSNLVGGDTNGKIDIFVRDRNTGNVVRVSRDSAGMEANGDSDSPAISADGRWVVFHSSSTNLVVGDMNNRWDIFLHDLLTGQTKLVSVGIAATEANGSSVYPTVSSDGRYVCFQSGASNLVAADTNGLTDVFLRDIVAGVTSRISVDSAGVEANADCGAPSISADGSCVVFSSTATNFATGSTANVINVFAHKRSTGETTCVSLTRAGNPGSANSYSAQVSANGRYVVFSSGATDLVTPATTGTQIFVRDLQLATTSQTSVELQSSSLSDRDYSNISADGRFVTYRLSTDIGQLLNNRPGAARVMLTDRSSGLNVQLGNDLVHSALVTWRGPRFYRDNYAHPDISPDGRYFAMIADATDFVPGDSNTFYDVFIRRMLFP